MCLQIGPQAILEGALDELRLRKHWVLSVAGAPIKVLLMQQENGLQQQQQQVAGF